MKKRPHLSNVTMAFALLLCLALLFGTTMIVSHAEESGTKITEIAIEGYVEPTSQGTPVTVEDLTVDPSAPYTVKSIVWNSLTDGSTIERQFPEAGGFRATITLAPKPGYYFPSEKVTDISINGVKINDDANYIHIHRKKRIPTTMKL